MTELVKVTRVDGGHSTHKITLKNYKGEIWRVQRSTLSDEEIESLKKDWAFVTFSKRVEKIVPCEASVAQVFLDDHNKRMLELLRITLTK